MRPGILYYQLPPLVVLIESKHAAPVREASSGRGVQFRRHLAAPPLGANHARETDEFVLAGGICGSYSKISKV